MLLIYSILLKFFILIKCPLSFGNIPSRIDYYESFSNPVICMEISHNFPTGPPYLHSAFSYDRYSTIQGKSIKREFARYTFKRIERRCETSVIFTKLGNDFERLEITIALYLSMDVNYLATFDYKFLKGFRPGVYRLLDIYKNFVIRVKVLNELRNYIGIPVSLDDTAQSYVQSASIPSDHLCVITKNNHAVVLHPDFLGNAPAGFIYGLQAMIFKDDKYIGDIIYPAYSCRKNLSYPNIDTIFITDGKNFYIQFKVLYLIHTFKKFKFYEIFPELNAKKFNLTNPKFFYVNELKLIPREYNQLFLMRIHGDFKFCPDGSWITLYYSENYTRYFVDAEKKIKFLPTVEFTTRIYRSLQDPCEEHKY